MIPIETIWLCVLSYVAGIVSFILFCSLVDYCAEKKALQKVESMARAAKETK